MDANERQYLALIGVSSRSFAVERDCETQWRTSFHAQILVTNRVIKRPDGIEPDGDLHSCDEGEIYA